MFCENCGKDSNSGIVYKRHIFCSLECRNEYFNKKQKNNFLYMKNVLNE